MLGKVALIPVQNTGVGFYRIIQPGRFLKRLNLATDVRTLPFSTANENTRGEFLNDRMLLDVCQDAVVIFTTIITNQEDMLRMLNLRHYLKAKWIVDIDDNYYAVPVDNPAHRRALAIRPQLDLCLSLADGVTVSVPALKELYGHLNKNIFVQKNGVDPAFWEAPPRSRRRRKSIRIGWEGAYGHRDDLTLVTPALRAVQRAFPEVELVAFGYKPTELTWEYHPWVSFEDYPRELTSLDLDIVIAPLVDSAYNRCKSNLRLLDAAMLGVPVVYSPTSNYRGFPGFPATSAYDWYEALSNLITDKEVRQSVGRSARYFALRNYGMDKLTPPLASWLKVLPRRTDLEP